MCDALPPQRRLKDELDFNALLRAERAAAQGLSTQPVAVAAPPRSPSSGAGAGASGSAEDGAPPPTLCAPEQPPPPPLPRDVVFSLALGGLASVAPERSCRLALDAIDSSVEAWALAWVSAQAARWVALRARRLQQYGGQPSRGGLAWREALPGWLERLAGDLVEAGVFPPDRRPNHVLVNEYAPNEGILPHTDGPAYYPVVATLSLGSPAVMHYERTRAGEGGDAAAEPGVLRVLLPRRSLVVTSDALYGEWLHSIPIPLPGAEGPTRALPPLLNPGDAPPGEEPGARTGVRVSVTVRHVLEKTKS